MKIIFTRLFVLIFFQMMTFSIYASGTGYEVELIIFEDTQGRYLHSEDWRYNDMLNNKKPVVEKAVKADPEYRQLRWSGSKLAKNLKRLKENSNYRVLVTKRWKQTGLDLKHAFKIPVNSNKTKKNQSSNMDTELNASTLITEPYITGNVKLIMSRYLHFSVDMQYIRPKIANNEFETNTEMMIPIVNERRMRSREIHYIDHPLVGVIVLATPYKIKSRKVDSKPANYKTL